MRKVYFFFIFCLSVLTVFSQSKSKWSLAASLNPMFCSTIRSSVNSEPDTYYKQHDQIPTKESYRFVVLTGNVWFNYSLGIKLDMQAGLGYIDVGFQRQQTDIKYDSFPYLHNTVYAGIIPGNRIQEKTSTSRNINYDFRFQYLHLPVLFNYLVKKSGDYRTNFYLTAGTAIDVLLKHQITAYLLDGFYIDGQSIFNISQTGYDARPIAWSLMIGGRVDYKLDKQLTFMLQPILAIYPVSITSGPESIYPYYFSANTGLIYFF